jgi:hypothetical protein
LVSLALKLGSRGDFDFVRCGCIPPQVAYEGKLYVFAGCGAKGRRNDLFVYDPATNSWEALPGHDGIRVRA